MTDKIHKKVIKIFLTKKFVKGKTFMTKNICDNIISTKIIVSIEYGKCVRKRGMADGCHVRQRLARPALKK